MGKPLGSSKVTVRYSVTLPEGARQLLKIREGSVVVFVEEGGRVYLSSEVK